MRSQHLWKLAGQLGPVVGALLLFASWVLQQSLLQQVASGLNEVAHAESVYQTYQSNNALFNAIGQLTDNNPEKLDRIRRFQSYNYELGLREMDQALTPDERVDVPPPAGAYDGTAVEQIMSRVQERLEKLQAKIKSKRESLVARKKALNTEFTVLYALGTILVLVGSCLKAADAIRTNKA